MLFFFFSWVGREKRERREFGWLEIRRRGSVGRFLAREDTDVRRCQDEGMNRRRGKAGKEKCKMQERINSRSRMRKKEACERERRVGRESGRERR